MTTLIPEQGNPFRSVTKYFDRQDIYQTEVVMDIASLAPGESIEVSTRLFAGAKEWEPIRNYAHQADVLAAARAEQDHRQHGLGNYRPHRCDQGTRSAVGLQVLCFHGENERASARDGKAEGRSRRRPHQDATRHDEAL